MAENQGDGLGNKKKKDPSDRVNRVLNYPGLSHFFDQNEKRYVRTVNGIPPDENGNVDAGGGSGSTAVFNGTYVQTVNGQSGAVQVTPSRIGAVPTSRRINGYELKQDVNLYAGDIRLTSSDERSVYEALVEETSGVTNGIKVIAIRPWDWGEAGVSYSETGVFVGGHSSKFVKSASNDELTPRLKNFSSVDVYTSSSGGHYSVTSITSIAKSDITGYSARSISIRRNLTDEYTGKAVKVLWANLGDMPRVASTIFNYEYDGAASGPYLRVQAGENGFALSKSDSAFDDYGSYVELCNFELAAELIYTGENGSSLAGYSAVKVAEDTSSLTSGNYWVSNTLYIVLEVSDPEYPSYFGSENLGYNNRYILGDSCVSMMNTIDGVTYGFVDAYSEDEETKESLWQAMQSNGAAVRGNLYLSRWRLYYADFPYTGTPLMNGMDLENSFLIPIWVNANPSSSFGTQTLTYGTGANNLKRRPGDFDFLLIYAKHTTSNSHRVPPVLCEPNSDFQILGKQGTNSNNSMCRLGSCTMDSITFGRGYSGTSANDGRLIPLVIFGVNTKIQGERGPRGLKGDKGDPGEDGMITNWMDNLEIDELFTSFGLTNALGD